MGIHQTCARYRAVPYRTFSEKCGCGTAPHIIEKVRYAVSRFFKMSEKARYRARCGTAYRKIIQPLTYKFPRYTAVPRGTALICAVCGIENLWNLKKVRYAVFKISKSSKKRGMRYCGMRYFAVPRTCLVRTYPTRVLRHDETREVSSGHGRILGKW